jgi:hypothetical protein
MFRIGELMKFVKSDYIRNEIVNLIKITLVLSIILYIIFALTGRYGRPIFLGIITGSVVSIINFVVLSLSIEIGAGKPKRRAIFTLSCIYIIKFVLIGAVIAIYFSHDYINIIAFIIPLFFPSIIFITKSLGTKSLGSKSSSDNK